MIETSHDATKFAAARLWAVTRLPYLASALFACSTRVAPGSRTIAVDRAWRVHADPAVVDTMATADLGRLLVHLSGHLLRDHAARADSLRFPVERQAWWNRCVDAEINDDLRPVDCLPPVAADLPADLGCDDGNLAESYFGSRPAPDGSGPDAGPWDCGSAADGVPRPWDGDDGLNAAQAELLRLGVAAEIRRHDGREPGSVPAGWLRWAEAVLPSKTDWRRVLAAEIRGALAAVAGSVDYTYRRPSRRGHSTQHVLPRAVQPALIRPVPAVAVVCDTSGSMHEELLARALAEVEGLLARAGLRSSRVAVLAVDTTVHTVRRVSRADQVQLVGGGGTDMGSGIAAAAALRPRPDVIVVLTDGMTPWPDAPPPGIRVVVGLLTEDGPFAEWLPPDWTRTILIDDH